MPEVATTGSPIKQSTKSNHVSYTERYQSGSHCVDWDDEGRCNSREPDYSTANYNSNAKITGTINGSHNVFVNGKSVVTVGDPTQEQWVADPSPYPNNEGSIISTSPGTSGSGQGSVTVGSPNVFVNGKALAYNGSSVSTHLGTTSSISSGSSNVIVN